MPLRRIAGGQLDARVAQLGRVHAGSAADGHWHDRRRQATQRLAPRGPGAQQKVSAGLDEAANGGSPAPSEALRGEGMAGGAVQSPSPTSRLPGVITVQ